LTSNISAFLSLKSRLFRELWLCNSDEEFDMIRTELDIPLKVADYELQLGEHLLESGTIFPQLTASSRAAKQDNNNRATLGRVLFYDKNLSKDRNIACGSCHNAQKAFSDDKQFSEGVDGIITKRNSLALGTTLSFKISYNPVDPAVQATLFSWDDSASSLEDQIALAFSNENEMDITDNEIIERLEEKQYYKILFERAYGDGAFTSERINESIVDFVNSISSKSTKFDKGLEKSASFSAERDFINFSESENLGKSIYNNNCATCHTSKHNFTVKTRANNGLDLEYQDKGVGGRLNRPSLNGVFKVPFLRNIALSAPYMHDGRFETLEEVVDHYSDNIVNHKNLSEELKTENGNAKKLNLSGKEKVALIDYLHTLTDYDMMEDERFADPFVK